ncbi:MAG: HAD family hydrolase [Phycisphaerae bacterium]
MAAEQADVPVVRLSGIHAVVLDLDDTLYPERAYAFSGFRAVGAWLRERLVCGVDPGARMCELYDGGERGRVFNRLLAEIGCDEADRLVPEMLRCYREHWPAVDLFADARAALEAWHGRFRLGLISDGPLPSQQRKVEALTLQRWFDTIILTDEWGREYWKPHLRAFRETENRLNCCGPHVVYIADNCGKDFLGPRRLGWRTVWVSRPGGLYRDVAAPAGGEPECRIESFAQLDLRGESP